MRAVLAGLKAQARLARAALRGVPAGGPSTRHQAVALGRGQVQLHVTAFGAGGPVFVNVHQNEQTSVQAARAVLQGRAGRLVELRAHGTRLLTFRSGLQAHTVDPNRIFTEAGLAATLAALGPDAPAARAAVRGLRDALLALLAAPPPPLEGPPIVALHNNGSSDYSVLQYQPGGRHAGDADRVHVGQPAATGDFFVVTQARLFEPLAADGFNTVLQAPGAADDGSLSVWAQGAGRPYVNVEARHGRLAAQQQMLQSVLRHFG